MDITTANVCIKVNHVTIPANISSVHIYQANIEKDEHSSIVV